jgi:hypothetical protein
MRNSQYARFKSLLDLTLKAIFVLLKFNTS